MDFSCNRRSVSNAVAFVSALVAAGFYACARPAPSGPRPAPAVPKDSIRILKAERIDFIGVRWEGGDTSQFAFDDLHELPQPELRKRSCTPECLQSIFGYAHPGSFARCSRDCLESFLSEKRKSEFYSLFPEPMRTEVKPVSYQYLASLRFFPDSVVFQVDSLWEFCDSARFSRNYSKTVRTRYLDWRVEGDTLRLARGIIRTLVHCPATCMKGDFEARDTVPVIALRFEMKQHLIPYRGSRLGVKSLLLPGKAWAEPVDIGD